MDGNNGNGYKWKYTTYVLCGVLLCPTIIFMVFWKSIIHFLLLPNYITLCGYTSHLPILLLIDIWVILIVQLLWKLLLPTVLNILPCMARLFFMARFFFKKLPCFGVADVRYINLQIRFASITIKMCDNSSYCTSLMKSNVWIFLANLLRVYWYIIMVFICSSLMIRLSTFSKVYLT